MKTVFTTQEGVKMNSDLDFGEINKILDEFHFFLETIETALGAYIRYYYRITDDSFIQIAVSVEGSELKIYAQFKLNHPSFKENLQFAIENMFEANLCFNGYPEFYESDIFTKEEFDLEIIGKIKNQKEIIEKQTLEKNSLIITFLEKQGLEPKPSGTNIGSWLATCPNSTKHFIQVVVPSEEWGCGFCHKKGKLQELKNWIQEINMKK